MTVDEITEFIEALGGVLTLRPGPGDGSPEIAWGDRFFYYYPDGLAPPALPDGSSVLGRILCSASRRRTENSHRRTP